MNKMTHILLTAALTLLVTVAAEAQIKITQSQYAEELVPMNLISQKGEVAVAFYMEIPGNLITEKELCVITPEFINGTYRKSLPPVVVEGKKFGIIARERTHFDGVAYPNYIEEHYAILPYNKKEGHQVHYQAKTAYDPQMKGAELVLNCKTYYICGMQASEENTSLAHGVTDHSGFIQVDPVVYYYANNIQKQYVNNFSDQSVFKIGQTEIDLYIFNRNGYNDLKKELEKLRANPHVTIDRIGVHTAASPEGPVIVNKRLAKSRAGEVAKYIANDLRIPVESIDKQWADENWEAFVQQLPASGLSEEQQQEILQVLAATENDWDDREMKLCRLQSWNRMYKMFQELRDCQISILYTDREQFDNEVVMEGINAAVVQLGDNTLNTSLEKTRTYYNEDPTSLQNLNNMMVALMDLGKYAEAEKYAEQIPNNNLSPLVANNKGVLYMYLNEPRLAQTMFEMAGEVPAARYNYGLMLLVDEQYAAAAEKLDTYNRINSAVANLCAGNNDKAARNAHICSPSGEIYYLCAIAYANDSLDELALNALAKAVKLDPAYKAEALNQAEFIGYRSNEKFITITQ